MKKHVQQFNEMNTDIYNENHIIHNFYRKQYQIHKHSIQSKLNEFQIIKPDQYFYELCFCLCTPQSKAQSALRVVEQFQINDFKDTDVDILPILRNPANYIRFHNTKAKNIYAMKQNYSQIEDTLLSSKSAIEKRTWLVNSIKGISWKEASHFMRNIGYKELAIIDRHILKHLVKCGVTDSTTFPNSSKRYLSIEQNWKSFCTKISIPLDECDLLFWSMETGYILK